ncbi:hypothetical protein XA68_16401 [Ophiocordyceps unilateralis]|uniref:Uncharacterized protein n=1 Tax=Ophiocordyceps unilateralis TaxID=268505 RepID=A0A2A9P6J1_OPHUN|nr:hypothetical protein XA68_16401 [Ophiocordyceps unilateralis]
MISPSAMQDATTLLHQKSFDQPYQAHGPRQGGLLVARLQSSKQAGGPKKKKLKTAKTKRRGYLLVVVDHLLPSKAHDT